VRGEEVRAVPIATIVQAVEGGIMALAALIGAVVTLRKLYHARNRRDRSAEAVAPKPDRRRSVGAASATPKEKCDRAKLDEAQILINLGHYSAAIAILDFALEYALQDAVRRSNIKLNGSLKSSIQIANALFRANAMDKMDVAAARMFSEIRDSAAHGLIEPSASDAWLAVALLRRILRSVAV
jgi:hypothetical protein